MGAADSPWVVAVTYGRRLLVAERDEAEEFAHAQQRLQVVLERAVRHACTPVTTRNVTIWEGAANHVHVLVHQIGV